MCAFLTKQYVKLLRTLVFLKLRNKETAPVLYLLNENVQERKILNHQSLQDIGEIQNNIQLKVAYVPFGMHPLQDRVLTDSLFEIT